MKKPQELFSITDHLCVNCGGRILLSHGYHITGGGNPMFRCADCGKQSAGMSEAVLCWCGFKFRGQIETAYQCLPFKGNEHLRYEFAKSGCDIESTKAEVGVVCSAARSAKKG